MQRLADRLGVPPGTDRIVLCFGFQHSKAMTRPERDDWTGAEILIETLKKRFIPDYFPVIVTYGGTDRHIRNSINSGIYFNSNEARYGPNNLICTGIQFDPFFAFPFLAEIEDNFRRFPRYQRRTHDEIRRISIEKIGFWRAFFSEFDEVFYINGNVPHVADDLIAYRVAQHMGCRTISTYRLPIVPGVSARLMFFTDAFRQDLPLQLPRTLSPATDDLTAVHDVFAKGMARDRVKPALKQNSKTGAAHSRLIRALDVARTLPVRLYWRIWASFSREHLKALKVRFEYRRRSTTTAPERFIYFPLHMQPEASSRPLGGIYADQVVLIDALAAALPEGVKLVVKEHPLQFDKLAKIYFRRNNFYKRVVAHKNVVVLHHSVPSPTLLARCIAAVTLTGTTAFEALSVGKYCFVMGASPFVRAPNALVPKSQDALRAVLARLADGQMPPIEPAAVTQFLDWLRDHSVFGYLDPYTHPRLTERFSPEDNIDAVSGALCHAIDQLRGSKPIPHNDAVADASTVLTTP